MRSWKTTEFFNFWKKKFEWNTQQAAPHNCLSPQKINNSRIHTNPQNLDHSPPPLPHHKMFFARYVSISAVFYFCFAIRNTAYWRIGERIAAGLPIFQLMFIFTAFPTIQTFQLLMTGLNGMIAILVAINVITLTISNWLPIICFCVPLYSIFWAFVCCGDSSHVVAKNTNDERSSKYEYLLVIFSVLISPYAVRSLSPSLASLFPESSQLSSPPVYLLPSCRKTRCFLRYRIRTATIRCIFPSIPRRMGEIHESYSTRY